MFPVVSSKKPEIFTGLCNEENRDGWEIETDGKQNKEKANAILVL